MGLANILRNILNHPLNRDKKVSALFRFGRWQVGSRLLNYPIVIDFVNQSKLLVLQGMAGATGNIYSGLHDFEEMSFLLHLLRPGDMFVDVGANVGTYTVLAGSVVGCQCLAIEPIPEQYEHLLDNVFLNRIGDLVEAHNIGVGAENEILSFSTNLGPMNQVVTDPPSNVQSIDVPVKRLDDIVCKEKPVAIKIDVEGFETQVIAGSRVLLEQNSLLAIVMELNGSGKRYGYDEEALHRRMTDEFGFQSVRYDPFSRELVVLGKNRDDSQNQIYVRELDTVSSRLRTAPKFLVNGRAI